VRARLDAAIVRLSRLWARPALRRTGLTLYYLAVLVGLVLLYGRGDFSAPAFIYQNF